MTQRKPATLNAAVVERLRGLGQVGASSRPPARPQPLRPAAAALLGYECENAAGRHWRIECGAGELLPALDSDLRRRETPAATSERRDEPEPPHPELQQLAARLTTSTLFLDLETCGFAGSIIFLVGLVRPTSQGLMLTQLLARNYAEEKAILHSLWMLAAECELLVTFNGKSFDWPCVHDRSTLHHLGQDPRGTPAGSEGRPTTTAVTQLERHTPRPQPLHIDLLHHSRRQWRARLPNCRLQTLEQHVCGRFRVADIAGADIPAAYHHYVQTGNTGPMHSILHHNALDLLTLVQVALRLCAA